MILKKSSPSQLIKLLSEDLLSKFKPIPLVSSYDLYQQLMDYWVETMQDDCYLIIGSGWKDGAKPYEVFKVKDKNNKLTWSKSDLILQKENVVLDLICYPQRY